MNDILGKLSFLDIHTEHEFVTIEDKLEMLDERIDVHLKEHKDGTLQVSILLCVYMCIYELCVCVCLCCICMLYMLLT